MIATMRSTESEIRQVSALTVYLGLPWTLTINSKPLNNEKMIANKAITINIFANMNYSCTSGRAIVPTKFYT